MYHVYEIKGNIFLPFIYNIIYFRSRHHERRRYIFPVRPGGKTLPRKLPADRDCVRQQGSGQVNNIYYYYLRKVNNNVYGIKGNISFFLLFKLFINKVFKT